MTKLAGSFVTANSTISVFSNNQDENTKKKLLSNLKIQKSQANTETI